MANLGKLIVNRIDNGKYVASASTVHHAAVAAGLQQVGEEVGLPPPAEASLSEFVCWLGKVCEARSEQLHKAEQTVADEIADDPPVRQRRDEAQEKLSKRLQTIRSLDDSVLSGKLAAFGLSDPVPTQPNRLVVYSQNAVSQLEKSNEVFELDTGMTFSPKIAATAIKPLTAELEAVNEELMKESREYDAVLVKRDEVLGSWNNTYQGTATALEGLFRLAGQKELADRVRPTASKQAGIEPPPEPLPTQTATAGTVTVPE